MDLESLEDDPLSNSSESLNNTPIPVAEEGKSAYGSKKKPPEKKTYLLLPTKRTAALFIAVILMLAAVIGGIIYLQSKNKKKQPTTIIVNTQSLDSGTLNKITVQAGGTPQQQLTISPDTIFKGSVDIQKSATIGQNLTVKGSTLLEGPVIMRDSLEVNKSLTVGGSTTIGNNLSVGGQISAGSISVGSITLSSINLSGNLTFAGHIIPNGSKPSIVASVASAGGSVTITGNDTSGTVTINIGTGVITPGEMAIITFSSGYNTTPKVQITPISSSTSTLRYYATRSPKFFTIDTSSAPSPGAIYAFDYFVTQ